MIQFNSLISPWLKRGDLRLDLIKKDGRIRVNIRELAKLAGVSPATVSLVMNDRPGVGKETRNRILQLAVEHDYVLGKRSKELKNILFLKYIKHGMIVEDNAGFVSAIMDSVENDCCEEGYTLNVKTSENKLSKTLTEIQYHNYQGIIFLGTELDESEYSLLNNIPIPYVVIDNVMPHFHCNSIAIDNFEIVYGALKYLKELGHQEIAYFKSNIAIQNFVERSNAFLRYADKFDLKYNKINEFAVTPTMLGAYKDLSMQLKDKPKLPSCAFADNDTIAVGAIKALKKAGYKVPEDISVIGFDDIPFAAINSPTLTTMRVPKKMIGTLALMQLHRMIEDEMMMDQKTRVGGELVVRHSTAEYNE